LYRQYYPVSLPNIVKALPIGNLEILGPIPNEILIDLIKSKLPVADAIWISRLENIEWFFKNNLFNYLKQDCKVIFDTEAVDVEQYRSVMVHELIKLIDKFIVVNNIDQNNMIKTFGRSAIVVGHKITVTSASYNKNRKYLLFIGNLQGENTKNFKALKNFIDLEWSVIRNSSDVDLKIVGSVNSKHVHLLQKDGIELLGSIENIDPILEGAIAFICPSHDPLGQPHKVFTATQAGVPCILSPTLAIQMNFQENIHCLVADNAFEYLKAISTLKNDGDIWNLLSKNSQTKLLETSEETESNLQELINYLIN
jgi:hypothetical protein